jgi:hypothetical protein
MRFRFRVADATPREASAGAFRVGDGPISFVPSDTFGSFASIVAGFRASEVLRPSSPTPPVFIGVWTRFSSFRAPLLRGSQAKKAVTVPTCAGYSLGDLGKAAKGLSVPGKALIEHHHPFQFASPLAHEQRSRVEANSVPRRWLAVVERTSGEINRSALRSANHAQRRFIEIA